MKYLNSETENFKTQKCEKLENLKAFEFGGLECWKFGILKFYEIKNRSKL